MPNQLVPRTGLLTDYSVRRHLAVTLCTTEPGSIRRMQTAIVVRLAITCRIMKSPMLALVALEVSLLFIFGIVVSADASPDVVDTSDDWFPGASAHETAAEWCSRDSQANSHSPFTPRARYSRSCSMLSSSGTIGWPQSFTKLPLTKYVAITMILTVGVTTGFVKRMR
jgi:hypothetical protein